MAREHSRAQLMGLDITAQALAHIAGKKNPPGLRAADLNATGGNYRRLIMKFCIVASATEAHWF